MNSPIACNRKCRGAAAWRDTEGARRPNDLMPYQLLPNGRLSLNILCFTAKIIARESLREPRPPGRNFCRGKLQLIGPLTCQSAAVLGAVCSL